MKYDLIVVGGGAAGFFTAIQLAERRPDTRILILEKSKQVLSKVRVSGGGRCNVTHACFDPRDLVGYYPRGSKELLGPFHRFMCGDMMGWLEEKGVETKIEEDGRVFPSSNSSESIIHCFLTCCETYGIEIKKSHLVKDLIPTEQGWEVNTSQGVFSAKKIMLAPGSSPAMWELLKSKGHNIVEPVPSLFTFNIQAPLLHQLPGISVPMGQVRILDTKFEADGPVLITHWGLSGPAVLKLSAWAARELHQSAYDFRIAVNWAGESREQVRVNIQEIRQNQGKKSLQNLAPVKLPKRLWHRMLDIHSLRQSNYASLRNADMETLLDNLSNCELQVKGKSTFKEEFVTCGGVDTREVHFKTMESKVWPGLYFAGEVLNIDAVTGGFNFQAAWTEAYIAAEAMAEES